MNKKDFMKAMSLIDDDLMRDADTVTKADTPEYEESVSGVEQYRRPVWQTVTTLAASLLLVIGVGAGGTYYLTHRGAPAPEEEQIIADSTAETETASAETNEQAEVTTVRTRKRDTLAKTTLKDTETKESTNTEPVTDPPEDEQPVTDSTDEQPKTDKRASTTTTYQVCSGAPLSTQTTVQTTAVPVQTESPQTYKDPDFYPDNPNNDPALRGYDQSALFADLASLSYSPYTCDGIPEYRLIAPDGTEYLINMSERWIWRRTPDMIGQSVEPEEAHLDLLGRQWWYLKFHGEEIGMQPDIYG